MVTEARKVRVNWPKYYRIIRPTFPPIDLFEDLANPTDWGSVIAASAKEDPTFSSAAGNLANVPIDRCVGGPGSTWVMAPFVHCSPRSSSRFSDGSFGIFYAGNSEQVALSETIHHHARIMEEESASIPRWTSGFQLLIGSVDAELHDVDMVPGTRNPSDYRFSQTAGKELRNAGSDGLTWTSVRMPAGRCIGVFWPDAISIPVLDANYRYHWDGDRIDLVENMKTSQIIRSLDLLPQNRTS